MKKSTLTSVHYVSEEGLQALHQQLATLENDYSTLRAKLSESWQVKDAEDFDLVDDHVHLAFLEKEILRMRHMIPRCKVLRASVDADTVQLGSKVRLQGSDTSLECMVVGALEADPSAGKISDKSPLGSALIGKALNSLVEVVAPHARRTYKIVRIGS